MRAYLNTPFMRTQQLNLIILSRWEKDKAYKVCWELSLNSAATISEACVVGGIVFARVRVLVASRHSGRYRRFGLIKRHLPFLRTD